MTSDFAIRVLFFPAHEFIRNSKRYDKHGWARTERNSYQFSDRDKLKIINPGFVIKRSSVFISVHDQL